ncbi:hypothetical protein AgCh_014372 [Apium graveolens]
MGTHPRKLGKIDLLSTPSFANVKGINSSDSKGVDLNRATIMLGNEGMDIVTSLLLPSLLSFPTLQEYLSLDMGLAATEMLLNIREGEVSTSRSPYHLK